MNKKSNRLLAALLIILMLLSACGNNTGTTGASTSASAVQDGTDKAAAASSGAASPAGTDKGANAQAGTELVTPAGTLPIVTQPYTVKIGLQKYGQVVDYINNNYTKYIQDNTGITLDIEVFPQAEANQKMEVLIASSSTLPDAFMGGDFYGSQNRQTTVYRHAQNGVFIQLDELIEKYGTNMKAMSEKVVNKNFMNLLRSPDGHFYALPNYNEQTSNEYSLRACINKTWLDKLNLPMPKTTEDLYNVLKAFKTQDPNGNGQADEIGVMGGGGWHQLAADFLMNAFIYDDGETRWNIKDGKLDVPYNKEGWREGLRYLNRLCEEGLFDPLSFTQDQASYKAIATAGDRNSIGVVVMAGMGQIFAASMADRKSEYVPLDPLSGPSGICWAARYPVVPNPGTVITKDCANPEVVMRMADFMMSEESSVFSRFGKPETDWTKPASGDVALGAKWGATPAIKPILVWGGTAHSSHWNDVGPHILLQKYTDGQAWNGNPTDAEYMIAQCVPGLLHKEPAEVATLILYDKEQTAQIADIQTTLTSYVKETLARFATGDMDLEKDWDGYLKELDRIGLAKYIEVSQSAYDKMMKK